MHISNHPQKLTQDSVYEITFEFSGDILSGR